MSAKSVILWFDENLTISEYILTATCFMSKTLTKISLHDLCEIQHTHDMTDTTSSAVSLTVIWQLNHNSHNFLAFWLVVDVLVPPCLFIIFNAFTALLDVFVPLIKSWFGDSIFSKNVFQYLHITLLDFVFNTKFCIYSLLHHFENKNSHACQNVLLDTNCVHYSQQLTCRPQTVVPI